MDNAEEITERSCYVKRIALLLAIGAILVIPLLHAAAPLHMQYIELTDTITVDSCKTCGFEQLDDVIYISTDSCLITYEVTGVAILSPGQELWLGLGKDSANRISGADLKAHNNIDSGLVAKWPMNAQGTNFYVPFHYVYKDSIEDQTDITDTVFLNAATMGSGMLDKVHVQNLVMKVFLGDQN